MKKACVNVPNVIIVAIVAAKIAVVLIVFRAMLVNIVAALKMRVEKWKLKNV